jgi:hypothetical protein
MSSGVVTAINSAVSGVATSVEGLITTNLPIVLGVTAALIGLGFAKKLVRKATS